MRYSPSRLPAVRFFTTLVLFVSIASSAAAQTRSEIVEARRYLVEHEIAGAGITNEKVLEAMLRTPRHEFIPRSQRPRAYYDMALPIGDGQTISSPFIVAFMTESLDPQPDDRVLEIGTGSGYQAAVLSPLVSDVYTIEIVEALGRRAARTLDRLSYDNVHVRVGDGFQGWPEHAPFDKIIVTCSPESVPRPLVEQLAEGGRLVIPVGERFQQTLYLFTKTDGELVREALRPTLFVPMTGVAEDRREVQPDPTRPEVVNGGFEQEANEESPLPGWYYLRQFSLEEGSEAREGTGYVTFHNTEPGRGSRALQGFALDGREIAALDVSAWIKHSRIFAGPERNMHPMIAVSFFDEDRRDLGHTWVGPWLGSEDWHHVEKELRVPARTREAIIRIGLFGATGEISFDDVQMRPIER